MNKRILVALGLLAQLFVPAFGQNAQPAAPAASGAALDANERTVVNRAVRNLIEQQDPATKQIFDKYPNFGLVPPPAPARGPAAAAPARPDFPREHIAFTNGNLTNLNPSLPTLFIAGDSTAAQNANSIQRGWGAVLVDYFDTSKVNLVNYAQAGASFPSFYGSRWPAIVAAIKPGDFVVIEFGHNGGHLNGIGEETGPAARGGNGQVYTYGAYIRKYASEVRAKGGFPIISSPTVRNIWSNPNAKFTDSTITSQSDGYSAKDDQVERGLGGQMLTWINQVVDQEKLPYVDHSNITADLYNKMGREAVAKLFIQDHTHTTTEGAVVNAETFVAGLKTLPNMPLAGFLNDKGKALPAYQPAGK